MATGELLAELVRAHYADDQARFGNLLNQVIAAESRAGHVRLAERLRHLRAAQEQAPARATTLARPPRELSEVLSVEYSEVGLRDVVLGSDERATLESYIVEQRAAQLLSEHGLRPRRRLLLHGPPGSGKTLIAHAFAGELSLPLARVRLEVLFSRYLGETAAALADVIAHAARVRGVYLFDEFDALGRTRLADNDVGEIKRIVTTFLQLLDADPGDSVFVAATNIGGELDPALFRRFDDVLELAEPTPEQAGELLARLLRLPPTRRRPKELAEAAHGLSFADIRAAVDDARKDAVLSGGDTPTLHAVQERLRARAVRLR